MLLAIARLPGAPGGDAGAAPAREAIAAAAEATGLPPAELRFRLAGPLPRVLRVEPDAARAEEVAAALEAAGFGVLVLDPRAVPGDVDRVRARTLVLGAPRLTVIDAAGEHEAPATGDPVARPSAGRKVAAVDSGGEREEIDLGALALIQRGVRTSVTRHESTETHRRLDLPRALVSGGLILTKKVTTKSTRTTMADEAFLVLHRTDGGADVIIYESQIDYRCLGGDLQPSRAANFERLVARLRAAAPRVPYDDRAARPGFVSALPATVADPTDLALWLVLLAHLRGFA